MKSQKVTFEKILKKTKKDISNFEYYNAMYILCRDEEDGDTKWEMCRELKECIAESVSKKGCTLKKELQEVFCEVLLLEARGCRFDSYMQYLELDREPSKRFWLPRREKLMVACNAIQDLIDDKLDIVTISMPPGTGKSTLKIYLYSMLIGANPDSPCLESAHSGKLTKGTYNGVLQILNDKDEYRWREIFPNAGDIITNAEDTTIDVGKKHRFSSLTCRGIDGTLTGATRCEQIMTADDLVSGIEEAMSITRLDTLYNKYTNDLASRKKLNCKELHIATRWSVHDVIGRLEDMYGDNPRFKSVVMPALNEKDESNFDYDYGVGFSTEFYRDLRDNKYANDPVSFQALYMNMPIEREGLLYPEDELNRYFDLPSDEPDAIVAVCDTKDKGKDYCSMPVAYVYGQQVYIEDVIFDNSLPEIFTPRLVNCLVKNNVQQALFESNSAGGVIASNIEKELKEKGHRCHIKTEYTTANKETKIIVNSDWVKEHCYFKDKSRYNMKEDYGQFIFNLCSYTHEGKNAHDDAPDSMAMLALFMDKMSSSKVYTFKRFF